MIKLLNRQWILSILKDLFQKKTHFNEFKENKPGLSNVVLSDTMKYLEENRIITKKIDKDNPQKNSEYHLTSKGLKLGKILYEMTLYGLDELECVTASQEEKEEIKIEYDKIFNIEGKI